MSHTVLYVEDRDSKVGAPEKMLGEGKHIKCTERELIGQRNLGVVHMQSKLTTEDGVVFPVSSTFSNKIC